MTNDILEFPVSLYGKVEQVNDVISRCRLRIFYKYGNRNGSYITDEFAEELLKSLPYTPVKGIYEGDDFSDHGTSRTEGRIYGVVPENPNPAWEYHQDQDGVTRLYACTDVYIFTALYEEAKEIIGKSHSMELYEPSLKYHMGIVDGQKYAIFDHGCFLGLQVLGDDVEPCFEGASFFALQETIQSAITKIKEASAKFNKGGMTEMEINETTPVVETEETAPVVEETGTVTETTPAVEEVETPAADPVVETDDAKEEDAPAAETAPQVEEEPKVEDNSKDIKIEELTETITTLNTKVEEMQTEYTAAQEQISTLTEEVTALRQYKHEIETQQKQAVMAEYASNLSEEVLNTYKEKIDEYTVLDLDKELAYEMKKAGTSNFTQNNDTGVLPIEVPNTGIEAILSRYENKD